VVDASVGAEQGLAQIETLWDRLEADAATKIDAQLSAQQQVRMI
jgi:hypothetical protein